jgi:histidyl-tRNA synthetase
MRYADKIGAKYTCVLGDSEVENGTIRLKNMKNGETYEFNAEKIVDEFYNLIKENAISALEETVF